jgi:HEAT repeat protein
MAHELASLINNDPKLANDPRLLGEMCDLLAFELDHQEDKKLTAFVAHAVGAFEVAEGTLANGQTISPLTPLARALGAKYPIEVRIAAAMSLAKHASRNPGKVDDEAAVKALAEAAADQSGDLRQVSVYALGFFGGTHASEILRERIATDPDRFPRYNAAIALARRSDPAAAATLREMLTTSLLDKALSTVPEITTTSERQSKIESIELEALQGLRTSLDGGSTELAQSLRPEVNKLANSGLVSVRNSAQAVLQKLPEAR